MNEPKEGDVIAGKYRLLRRLGMGGMGAVYLANVEGLAGFEKLVALKIAHENLSHDPPAMEMFRQEARLSAQLQHANIGQIFDLGMTDDDRFFIAMEYVRGRDLRALMKAVAKRGARLPIALVVHTCARMLEGLDHAHGLRDKTGKPLKLVHRDVSPSNCLISYSGEVKLIDFGIAKAANQMTTTVPGMLRGKPPYFSPEQVRGEPLDRRSDVFAAGVMLYEMLVDVRPFDAESDLQTMTNIATGHYFPPRALDPEVPEALEAIVIKALANDRSARYATASEMQDALERYLMAIQVRVGAKDLARFLVSMIGADVAVAEGAPGVAATGETGPGLNDAHRTRSLRARLAPLPGKRAPTELRPDLTEPAVPTPAARELSPGARGPAATLIDDAMVDAPLPRPGVPLSRRARRLGVGIAGVVAVVGLIVWRTHSSTDAGEQQPAPLPERPVERVEPVKTIEAARPSPIEALPGARPESVSEPAAEPVAEQPVAEQPKPPPQAKQRPTRATSAPVKAVELQAFLTVRANRPSEVFVDGVSIGKAPQVRHAVRPGRHALRVDCLYDWGRHPGPIREVDLPPDAEAALNHECIEKQATSP